MTLRTKIRIISLTGILLFLFSLTGMAQNRDVEESLEEFTELKTFNGVEVQLIPSNEDRIEITGHSKHEVKFIVIEGRLEIRLSLDNIWSKDNTRITVHGTNIQTIDANQGSLVEVADNLEGPELTFRVQEGSRINARINAGKVISKAVTGGKIILEGKAAEQEVDINTGGHFFGKDLRTKETYIKAGTAARGEIYATDYVRATAKLGGTIEIFGKPKEVDQKTSLGGRIL